MQVESARPRTYLVPRKFYAVPGIIKKLTWQQAFKLAAIALLALTWSLLLISPRLAEPLYYPGLFEPTKFPNGNYDQTTVNGITRQEVFFTTAKGKRLHGWYFANPKAAKTVLYSHGNSDNLTHYLRFVSMLLGSGTSVFIYDYEGYGKSEGGPSLAGICRDGVAAYDYLRSQRHLKPKQIIIYGQSLGTGVSCFIASKRPAAGIILQSGFSSLSKLAQELYPPLCFYPSCLLFNQCLDNLAVLEKKHAPLLLVHGMKDDLIPVSHSEEMFKYAQAPKMFSCLPHATHDDGWAQDANLYQATVRRFLSSLNAG
jgi:fermentation-respiration switch protein FrsA (DUF1100 family)